MASEMLSDRDVELITPEQAAELLGVEVETLAVWRCSKKHLDYVKFGRSVRYKKADLLHFIEAHTVRL